MTAAVPVKAVLIKSLIDGFLWLKAIGIPPGDMTSERFIWCFKLDTNCRCTSLDERKDSREDTETLLKDVRFSILVLFVSSMFFTGKLFNSPREDFKMFGCLVILSGVKSWNPWWNWEAITQFHALPAAVVAQMCTSIGGTEWSFSCAFIILYCKTSESIWDTLAYWYVYIIRQSSFQRNSFMQQKTLQ